MSKASLSPTETKHSDRTRIFPGDSEMARRMREFDWSQTELGPPELWAEYFRVSVSICLTSRFPIVLWFGPSLRLLYNDAYIPFLGDTKHPHVLGRPGREAWAEIWPSIGPMHEAVRTGETISVEDLKMFFSRRLPREEVYVRFAFSPILAADGRTVEGTFCACTETTEKIIAAQRLETLRKLGAHATEARTIEAACEAAAEALHENSHDIPFAAIYLCDREGVARRVASVKIAGHEDAFPTTCGKANDFGWPWPLAQVAQSRHAAVVHNLPRVIGPITADPWPEPVDTAFVAPLTASQERLSGLLIAGVSPRRVFDAGYRSFLDLVAGHIASAIASAEAYQEERRRAETLAEIDRAKTLFFSNVSHEFRTPLTLMMSPLEEVLAKPEGEVLSDDRALIEIAHRNSLRLLKLVNSILDFSRIEAGRLQASFEPTDLAVFTAELVSNFRSATEKAGLSLRIDCPPLPCPVHIDREMWEKVVFNLLSNAFKFTFEGQIAVELCRSSDGKAAELTVRDTGVGVPPHELPRLFERFHRIEGQKGRSFEGSGIGLALVQELVKLHGGTIKAESEVGEGTVFTVAIPFGTAHLPADRIGAERSLASTSLRAEAYVEEALRWLPSATTGAEAALADRGEEISDALLTAAAPQARILIADDNADMRDYVARLLGNRWAVETFADGQTVLDAIRESKPDLVLTDVMMPRLDGFGLLREIRADPHLQDLPLIMLSARAGGEARVEGLDAGADDYLTKPFSARELIARVNTNLELARVRREATRELRESEARFRNMADNSPVIVWTTNSSGYCTFLGRSWYEFTGQTPETGLGFGRLDATHPDDKAEVRRVFLAANEKREAFRLEYRLRRADGQYRWTLDAAAPRFGDNGEFLGYIGSVIDITDRKEAERELQQRVDAAIAERAEAETQLRHAQKMEAIGKLTGGVAHDFNNLLQVIGGNLELLSKDVAGRERAERRLRHALSGVSRGAKLASQLLAFGRRQPLAPKVVNLGRLIRGMDDMLGRSIGEAIEIETVIAAGLWNTFVDPAQVENALLNMVINARDAMGGHGKLTIEAGNACLDDEYAARHAEVNPGQYVMIAVSDTGCGIAPEVMEHVFEPFFTTKREGQGTGLGLSMVYGFVKQSSGHIKIYSEPGHGTTIRIYLPRTPQSEDVPSDVDIESAQGGTETILVVEDDADVLAAVAEMLTDLGYRVLKAKNADYALAILESGARVDLLFTDVVMPGTIRSPELARRAQERLPGIAVLFTSGYTQNAIVHGGRLDDGVDLLSKPYSREQLARKLRHVIRNQQQRNASRLSASQMVAPEQKVCTDEHSVRVLRVLLVEDDELIRPVTAELLTVLGYSVLQAANAAEAIGLLEAHPVEVLLTDIGLPGTSGEELAAEACRRHPGLRVVFASGYDLPKCQRNVVGNAVFLQKPYTEDRLSRALNSAIG